MKPYKIEYTNYGGSPSEVWVDLDRVIQIFGIECDRNSGEPILYFKYILDSINYETRIEAYKIFSVYQKFIDAWKNKDIINSEKVD